MGAGTMHIATAFTFQYVSINTNELIKMIDENVVFTFQYVSINTISLQ